MELYIHNAILHVLNNDGGESYFSTQELDIDSDICYEFITKHVKKLLNNPAAKEATFKSESKVYGMVRSFIDGGVYFKDASVQICQHLSTIMLANVDIPSADILVARFEIKGDFYLAILKLNYKECFTHQVVTGADGADNQIMKCRSVLPFDSGKVEEACLIPYNPMVIRLLEKPYPVNGEQVNYFSELFLECGAEISKKEAARILDEVTEDMNQKFFNESIETMAKIKTALMEEAEEGEGYVSIENVAARVFDDNEEMKNQYIEMARDAGLRADIEFGQKFVKQQFGVQKFKAANGIELKFPVELIEDPTVLEIIHNGDGSMSIVLKNLIKG